MELVDLLRRGGVWHNVPGRDAAAVLSAFVGAIRLPAGMARDELSQATIRREASSSTAMGRGLAFPHPGNPMAPTDADAFVALLYPRFPIPWNAPDGAPVKAAFLIVSASRNEHLTVLSRLARLAGEDELYAALMAGSPLKELLPILEKARA